MRKLTTCMSIKYSIFQKLYSRTNAKSFIICSLMTALLLTSCGTVKTSDSKKKDDSAKENVSAETDENSKSSEDNNNNDDAYVNYNGYQLIKDFDVLPEYFADIRFVKPTYHDSLFSVRDINDNEIFTIESKNTPYFSEGLASFTVDNKIGFVDINGNVVIEPQFEMAGSFINGSCGVYLDGRSFRIDKEGNECEDTTQTYPQRYEDGDKLGYIDENGEITILDGVTREFEFCNGYAIVEKSPEDIYFINENYERVTGNLFEHFVDSMEPAEFITKLNGYHYVFEGGYAILRESGFDDHIVIKIMPELYSED